MRDSQQFIRITVIRLYGYLLLLYPHRFRTEFMEEISEIYLKVTLEAEQGGALWLVRISLRELIALVISIFHERMDEDRSLLGKSITSKDGRWGVTSKLGTISKSFIIWIVANILGISAVAALPLVFPSIISIHNEVLTTFIVLLPISLAQWLALRTFSRSSALWIFTIPVSIELYVLIYRYIPEGGLRNIAYSESSESISVMTSAYLLIGFIIGLLQWFILRRQFARSALWLLGSTAGVGFSFWLILATDLINQSVILAFIVAILIYTITTGLVLTWLIANRTKSGEILPISS
jgi:hypothetical protein